MNKNQHFEADSLRDADTWIHDQIRAANGGDPSPVWVMVNNHFAAACLKRAKKFDKEDHNSNRRIVQRAVNRYADAMANGQWMPNHQGLAFDVHGTLEDGQHRCLAVLQSGAAVPMLVTFGLPAAGEALVMDTGVGRTPGESLRRLGYANHKHLAPTARCMFRGLSANSTVALGLEDLDVFVKRHYKVLNLAVEGIFQRKSIKRISVAPVAGALARAYYHEDHERLGEFCDRLFDDAVYSPNDSAATKLKIALLSDHASLDRRMSPATIYAITTSAISKFCKGLEVRSLRPAQMEIYTIP